MYRIGGVAGAVLFTAIVAFVVPGTAFGATRSIPYSDGKQTGTFSFGNRSQDFGFADTVLLANGLVVTSYSAPYDTRPDTNFPGIVVDYCVIPTNYGLAFGFSSGSLGFGLARDTVWEDARVVPSQQDTLPFVPPPRYLSSRPMDPGTRGNLVGIYEQGAMCAGKGFGLSKGWNRLIYFRVTAAGGGTVYGKLMVYEVGIDNLSPLPSRLGNLSVAYVLASSTDVDMGPVAIVPSSASRASRSTHRLHWSDRHGVLIRDAKGQLYNLKGKSAGNLP